MDIFKNKERKLILAIESSCDETSVAVIEDGNIILSNIIASQINSHKRFGGVVPEVASRHHVEQIIGCMEEALNEAEVTVEDLGAVGVTFGPGLVGALLIGIQAAKSFAWANDLPLIPVNHMAGHIYAASFASEMKFPALALLVSGGHTELVLMKEHGEFEIIGETRDDACGEAYDKVGRVLGLNYPSGKEIDELAHKGNDVYHFPRGMMKEDNYDFSFSGLKSSFINLVHNAEQRNEELKIEDLAASFQASVIEVLVSKTIRAAKEYDIKQLILAGGVAANKGLRNALAQAVSTELTDVELVVPPFKLCGDNAAMIGAAAFIEAEKGHFTDGSLNAKPSITL
ncbi:tRNA (adenosine(37)-N6)-threonylcarbamoyltransferase complex transferase subunit TsaD [Vagococcus fluvialis]|uniref:tRNA (adenosine(37)-N6)-threonylcarbamoyltransferase complex transferase subunit TsaD n=1 Tax=Vagococcus fluvialis TaxID=2738 RepID=UPI0032E4B2E6